MCANWSLVVSSQPSQRFSSSPRPERRVACPQAACLPRFLPIVDGCRNARRAIVRQRVALAIEHRRELASPASVDDFEQGVEGGTEERDAIFQERVGDFPERNARAAEGVDHVARLRHARHEAGPQTPMIAEGLERCGGEGVHGLRTDQLLDVAHITVARVLGAGARPQQTLWVGASRGQRLPLGRATQVQVTLIGQLGVGDRHGAEKTGQRRARGRIRLRRQSRRDQSIDHRVNPAHEETGHTAHAGRITPFPTHRERPSTYARATCFVTLDAKEERDVDVDALAGQLPDGGQPLRGGRHLDHHVLPADGLPQAASLRDRRVGVVREIWRHLEADVSVDARRRVVHRPKQVRRVADVPDRQRL